MTSLSEEDRYTPWFNDGDVILAVEGKYFRVHSGVLASYSTVFMDMILCSRPDDPELAKIEGCPVVALYDSALDIQTVLQAMYNRGRAVVIPQSRAMLIPARYGSPAKPIPFPTLTVFLRLGKKYIIRQLYDEGKACLETFVGNQTTKPLTCNGSPSLNANISWLDKFNFKVMNFAREAGLFMVLPVVFFHCALSCPLEYILEGYEDDVVGPCQLSPENQRACLIGRDKLHHLYARRFEFIRDLGPGRAHCESQFDAFECENVCKGLLRDIRIDSPSKELWDPFTSWNPNWEARFCGRCGELCRSSHEQTRQKAWAELPSLFGLAQSWEELESATFSLGSDEAP